MDDAKDQTARERLTTWVNQHPHAARLAGLSAGAVLFLVFMPASVRLLIVIGLQSNKFLASMLFLFSLLAISLVWSTGQKLDAWAFSIFNLRGKHPDWLDRLMLGITQIGSGFASVALALILFLTGNSLLAYELILGTLTLWMVVELIKLLFNRSRPFKLVVQTRIVGYRAMGRSFPSGHTSQAFFMAALMAQHFNSNVWIVAMFYLVALVVGITRMYVGAHYPRDVLAGAIFGSAWGLLGVMINAYVFNWFG